MTHTNEFNDFLHCLIHYFYIIYQNTLTSLLLSKSFKIKSKYLYKNIKYKFKVYHEKRQFGFPKV